MVHPSVSLVLVLALAVPVFAFGDFGACPNVTVVQDFDITQYLGKWYEIVRTSSMPFESGTCDTANYSLLKNGHVNVTNSETRDGKVTVAYGDAYCDDDGTASCHVKFSKLSPYAGYQVLATDYKTYSVVLSCSSVLGLYQWSFGWVLSRTPTLNVDYTDLLVKAGIKKQDLIWTDQTNC